MLTKEGKRMGKITGEVLKQLRKEKGLSLQEVANYVGCSPSYLHRLEGSTRKNPSIQTASRLAAFYEVDVSILTGQTQEEMDDILINIEKQKEISKEVDMAIVKMEEALALMKQETQQSKQSFVEVQKSLFYIQSLI